MKAYLMFMIKSSFERSNNSTDWLWALITPFAATVFLYLCFDIPMGSIYGIIISVLVLLVVDFIWLTVKYLFLHQR